MKKIYIYFLLAYAAATLSFSCAKGPVESPVQEQPVGKTVTVTCAFPESDTKVAIDDANGKTTWQVGDKILIHGKYTSEDVTVTLTAGNIISDGKIASFTVTLPATPYLDDSTTDPNGYYAAYPAEAYIENSSGRGYHYNTFSQTNLPLMSASFDATANKFTFYNLCGIISFKVIGSYDSYMFMGNKNEVVGYDKYAVKTIHGQTPNYMHSSTASPKTAVVGPVDGTGATPNLICLPNGANFTDGFKLVLYDGVTPVKELVSSAIEVARNSYRPMGDISSYLKDYTAPVHVPAAWVDGTGLSGTVDKSASPANCHVLYAADANKAIKIKAVKGNGTDPVGTIGSVAVLWETNNTSTAVSEGDIVDDVDFSADSQFIYIKTPASFTAGNALIAAKDITGNILWSWHIWMPSVAISATDKAAVIGGNMMNMNLGALEEVPSSGSATIASLGLLYQWGRKDPFVGAAEWKDYPAKAAVAGSAWTKTSSRVTMDEAILHPTVLYIDPAKSDSSGWMDTPDASLWNNSGKKTIYDPCPAGYKVPVNTGSIWTKTDEGWTFDTANHVCELSGVRIPLAGYVECYGGSLYGNGGGKEHAYLWSATSHDGDAERAECVYIRAFRDSGKYYGSNRGAANAASVRCIAE